MRSPSKDPRQGPESPDQPDPHEQHDPTEPDPTEPETQRSGLGLSGPQVMGSALAAMTAAVFASWLGVAGTVIGAAVGSLCATIGGAVYSRSLHKGSEVVRRSVRPSRDGSSVTLGAKPRLSSRLKEVAWGRVVVGATLALGLGLGGLTVVEKVTGKPISTVTNGRTGSGTTVGNVLSRNSKPAPTRTPTEKPTHSLTTVESSPTTSTPTLTNTPTPTVTVTVSPTESVEPTTSETGTPTENPTPEQSEAPAP